MKYLIFASLLLLTGAGTAQSKIDLKNFLNRPKLVVVIVIDQFRSDYLTRFEKQFLPATDKTGQPGGFKYLMSQGAYFPFATFDILQSMTCPGHAMILSGTNPARMGIPLNDWYDPKEKRTKYCVEDELSPIVGSKAPMGMSPKNFTGSTLTDEIKNAGIKGKTITVALKDRGAILLGGAQADLALWFDFKEYKWISSRYYLPTGNLPDWVTKLNGNIQQRLGKTFNWKHGSFKIGDEKTLHLPFGNELTADAALQALQEYKLGQTEGVDILGISFSSHDYLGHELGPNAKEMETMTLAEDVVISRLIRTIKKSLPGGLKDVVFVLTADHGVAPSTDFLKNSKLPSGQISQKKLWESVNQALEQKFGKSAEGSWITQVKSFNFYLNHPAIQSKKLNLEEVENFVRDILKAEPGVHSVYTRSEFQLRSFPPGPTGEQIKKSFEPSLSGDLIIIPKPFFYAAGNPATHMTGYSYDTNVPILFSGQRFIKGVFGNRAEIVDIAPTLSFVLGVLPPATSEGRVLTEALKP